MKSESPISGSMLRVAAAPADIDALLADDDKAQRQRGGGERRAKSIPFHTPEWALIRAAAEAEGWAAATWARRILRAEARRVLLGAERK